MPPILFSPPDFLPSETDIVCQLFEKGLSIFHVRKKTANLAAVSVYLNHIPEKYHHKMVLHNHFELLADFQKIGGLHFNAQNPFSTKIIQKYPQKSYTQATHSFAEIESISDTITYCFLSPIYSSISKENYHSPFSEKELTTFLAQYTYKPKIVALGGICPENIQKTLSMGFDNVALLGYIWDDYRKDISIQNLLSRWDLSI